MERDETHADEGLWDEARWQALERLSDRPPTWPSVTTPLGATRSEPRGLHGRTTSARRSPPAETWSSAETWSYAELNVDCDAWGARLA